MQIDVPYDYINILLFKTLLQYENTRMVRIGLLNKYHEVLLEEVIKDYETREKTGQIVCFSDDEKWEGEIEFNFNGETLDSFLENFSDLVYRDDDFIRLCDGVSFDDINNYELDMRITNSISTRFMHASENDRLFNLLGISSIRKNIEKYIEIENRIEKCYSEILKDDTFEMSELKRLLIMRAIFLNNVYQSDEQVMDAFRLESIRIYGDDSSYEYVKAPIDLDLWKKSEYYNDCVQDVDDVFDDIDDRIYDIYQYAIFGQSSLAVEKVREMLENLYLYGDERTTPSKKIDDYFSSDDFFDEENTFIVVDDEESNLLFYLTYLRKLEDYMITNGVTDDLINSRNRLLYALDMPKLGLFKRENFEKELEKASDYELDEDYFWFMQDEVRFMADEVFKVEEDSNTVKKLLFISTYYELIGDEKIPTIIDKHRDDERYDSYSNIVFGEQDDKVKGLVLKP